MVKQKTFHQSRIVPGLWKHESQLIQFALVVDDFEVKFISKEHSQYLLDCLTTHYNVSTDWKGEKFIGLTLDWDYGKQEMNMSVPGYIEKALQWFQCPWPAMVQDSPFSHMLPKYGKQT